MNRIHSNPEHFASMVIGSGHTIMANHIPEAVGAQAFAENFYQWAKINPESIEQFGLFGGDINYHTYYPELKKEDLTPKDEEFIEPMFRLLSETVVSKNWNPTDFSTPGVLKASMKMLLGQTVNCDHETNIGNAIGSVSKVVWQEAYKDGNFTIPAGINGILKIDGKANPRIARGILMEPPSIHSNSVTVQFKWDKSHPELDDNDFYHKIGTYDEKGNLICRKVTEIIRYLETSLVSHGADSFAQKIGEDGKLVNPEFAKRTWSSFAEYTEDTKKQYFFSDCKTDLLLNEENLNTPEPNTKQEDQTPIINNKEMKTLQEFIASLFGEGMLTLAEGQEQNADSVVTALKELVSDKASLAEQVTNLTEEKATLTEQINNLNTQVSNLQEMATVGKNHIAALRETAVANYKKLKGDQADETIITMINSETTGLSTVISLNKEYTSQLEEKFPMTCSKCGSHDISRASSAKEEEDPATQQNSEETNENLLDRIYNQKV